MVSDSESASYFDYLKDRNRVRRRCPNHFMCVEKCHETLDSSLDSSAEEEFYVGGEVYFKDEYPQPEQAFVILYPDCRIHNVRKFVRTFRTTDKNESLLIAAARNGQYDHVNLLLHFGADVNAMSSEGETAFSVACKMNRIYTAVLLLERGSDVGKLSFTSLFKMFENHWKISPVLEKLLHYGAKKNWSDVIRILLTQFDVDVNKKYKGKTSLISAAGKGYLELVEKLVEHGARLDKKSSKKTTALHVACKKEHYDVVNYLLDKGAKVDVADSQGRTPLFFCALQRNLGILNLLLVKGASVNARDHGGDNALLFGLQKYDKKRPYRLVMETLLANGSYFINFTKNCSFDEPALVMAVKFGHGDVLEYFLRSGVDPNSQYGSNKSLLAKACELGRLRCVEILLKHGVNPNQADSYNRTPLMLALEYCYSDLEPRKDISVTDELHERMQVIRLLLQFKAGTKICRNVAQRSEMLMLPFELAMKSLDSELVDKTYDNYAKHLSSGKQVANRVILQGLTEIIRNSRIEVVKLLADADLAFGINDVMRMTPCRKISRTLRRGETLPDPACCAWSQYINRSIISAENGKCVMVHLFKAGVSFYMLSKISASLDEISVYNLKYNSNTYKLFLALALSNGIKINVSYLFKLLDDNELCSCQQCHLALWFMHKGPLTLRQMSRIAVRKQLIQASKNKTILGHINELPLPEPMKLYLKFEGLLSEIDLN